MPVVGTKGAMSSQGFGEFAQPSAVVNYIEDVFNTYLYTGNNTSQTITNNIDLSGKGGLVWIKSRGGTYVREHYLYDTARGTILSLSTDTTGANSNNTPNGVSSYNSNGFNIVGSFGSGGNGTGTTYASWTIRKQAKFFDIVTYTGTGANRTIAHSLGATPGCIIVKRTDTTSNWQVYHSGLTSAAYSAQLNLSTGQSSSPTVWNSTAPTSTVFSVGTDTSVNASGGTYVAYIYASNAGGFGLTGTDNVITCGSFTAPALNSSVSVTLGYEPQWILFKDINNTGDSWYMADSMRGLNVSATTYLSANNSNAEGTISTAYWSPTATGFTVQYGASYWFTPGNKVIYIAIRRGPMKVPTDATKVFAPTLATANAPWFKPNFVVDTGILASRSTTDKTYFGNRLRGSNYLNSSNTNAEFANGGANFAYNNGWNSNTTANSDYVGWNFQRAPSFHDVVCWTTIASSSQSVTHNLGAVPELMIIKSRTNAVSWYVYSATTGNSGWIELNAGNPAGTRANLWGASGPTSTTFTFDSSWGIGSGQNVVTYLFATCAGVSKVGSYTGTGATQTISCGFTGGAKFVLIKRTDSTGDWWIWDTTRGMVAGTDPRLALDLTSAETNANWVYTTTGGFQIVTTDASVNASGGTYIFLAIA